MDALGNGDEVAVQYHFKVSAMTPNDVAQDLAKQGLVLSPSFIQQTAQRVGQLAVQKRTRWDVRSPEPERPVRTIATGLDGTTVPLWEEHYKEAMCGTIALYDGKGQRLATDYLGACPKAAKGSLSSGSPGGWRRFRPAIPARGTSCSAMGRRGIGNCLPPSTQTRLGFWTSGTRPSIWPA